VILIYIVITDFLRAQFLNKKSGAMGVQKNHHPTITVRNGIYPFFLKRGKDGKEGMGGGDDGEEERSKKKMVERERER
jgi:hypothetical protein